MTDGVGASLAHPRLISGGDTLSQPALERKMEKMGEWNQLRERLTRQTPKKIYKDFRFRYRQCPILFT
ncbi:hypothetical protein Pmani_006550 [Petrolisthes manimaculis]|uniref:Uncharacterized protein n=1 Tax=Petrolisthes manimaculis TaxID=1843537 RepID=A0AAE1QA61_9EUCA|nr:hypothetical protein Pmani_006550 [Petrolisthes manimaculis]